MQDNEFLRAVETGFWRGVSRAFEDGLNVSDIVGRKGSTIELLAGALEEKRTDPDKWIERGFALVSEFLTVGIIARDNNKETEVQLNSETIKEPVECLGRVANSAKHKGGNGKKKK